MRFLVFGAGAMGSLIGATLARRHDVTLVGRGPHVHAVRERGLVVQGQTQLHERPRALEDAAQADSPDVVIVTVKSYDTVPAVEALRCFWTESAFLSLQNGLGNVEALAERAPRVFGGVTYHGVTFLEPGRVEHAGSGDTVLGPYQGTSLVEADRIAAAFQECGLAAITTEGIRTVIWEKAVVNACFNPLTGLLHARSGVLASSEHLLECCELVVKEAVAVASAHGIALEPDRLMNRVRAVSSATSRNKSSMVQDMERGRRTEIDAINGAIHRLGRERGIDCPANHVLTLLVKAAGELVSSPWRA